VERAAVKGPDAFRTISEVAQELQLPQHVLRFWETRFAQIRPMKRGGGRRYYRPDDIDLLRGIRHLLYGEGYTIRGVQRILREQGPRSVISAGQDGMPGHSTHHPHNGEGQPGDVDVETPDLSSDGDGYEEPTFDPREFRSSADGNGRGNGENGSRRRLADDEVRQLQKTLVELLDLKRMLDQSR
jgi:DNA-binding transcriptional MerR regulator